MKRFDFSMKLIVLAVCAAIAVNLFYTPKTDIVSAEDTEMRGIWVASVGNLDYPQSPTADAWQLRVQMDEVLDNCQDMGFNTVFLQVRPSGDALYKSDIFPWSRYLTGTQGTAPSDGFDPLEYAVNEAHKRGMQLHAWINPYRVTNSSNDNGKLAANNPAVLRPDLVLTDSSGKMYLNPGEADSIDIILEGIREIVRNYDVDGIHMDDYFYPSSGFDDSAAYFKYQDAYPNKADWRRSMLLL
ncbi:MAG: glycoside hydrolase family 10 protein [Monoglobus pectinilyticus]